MAPLADSVSVRTRFARSANLERDSGRSEPFDGYIVTGRALDMIERLTSASLKGSGWRRVVASPAPTVQGNPHLPFCLTPHSAPAKRLREVRPWI